ncbi:endonuclease/exonuclease/phosphatase family protein [Geodermatophilus sp. SYSU D00804]
MRIGTWNVNRVHRESDRASDISAWLSKLGADLWLLTEVHSGWHARGDGLIVSPQRSWGPDLQRWAAIETHLPATQLLTAGDDRHPGEEGLALARVEYEGVEVLVACSVLPIEGSGENWRGLPEDRFAQFRFVLDHHADRIRDARRPDEQVIWGGDFTQELAPLYSGGTPMGAAALRSAFEELGLVVLTEDAERLNEAYPSIDHLAVSREIARGPAEVHRPTWRDDKDLSDHAAYTADVVLPRT